MDQADTRVTTRERELYAWWRGVQVTDATVTVADVAYDVREMRGLRERLGRPSTARRVVTGVALVLAAVVAMVLAGLVRANGATPTVYAVGLAQAVTTTVVIGLSRLWWPRPVELWVSYRGRPTLLYRSADRYEYGKVLRAVLRAMQAHRLMK